MSNKQVYIVAEMSSNHCQNYEIAEAIVKVAKWAGADAIKLQTFTPDTMTIKSDRPEFVIRGGTPWGGMTLYEIYQRAFMPWEWQPKLNRLADDIGIELFSTPYDKTAVDFLETIGVQRYKIASYELVDIPLITYVASKKKPMILSTGMAVLGEIKKAVSVAKDNGVTDITLLKCVAAYPASIEDMDLRAIPHLRIQFPYSAISHRVKISVGLSDHTLGGVASIVAVALGATMVEKHLTLSRKNPSLDSTFSLEPHEFKGMVDDIRRAEQSLGEKDISISEAEKSSLAFRRSLFVVEDMKAGDTFSEQNVRSIRSSLGLLPEFLGEILGKVASQDIGVGTPLQWELVKGESED